jgi:zinc transporter ZupT
LIGENIHLAMLEREGPVVDRYTKVILTVIAAALVAIVVQQAVPSASAAGSQCEGTYLDPCWVKIMGN